MTIPFQTEIETINVSIKKKVLITLFFFDKGIEFLKIFIILYVKNIRRGMDGFA